MVCFAGPVVGADLWSVMGLGTTRRGSGGGAWRRERSTFDGNVQP